MNFSLHNGPAVNPKHMEPTTVAFFSSVIIFAVRLASIPASTVWQVAGPLA